MGRKIDCWDTDEAKSRTRTIRAGRRYIFRKGLIETEKTNVRLAILGDSGIIKRQSDARPKMSLYVKTVTRFRNTAVSIFG